MSSAINLSLRDPVSAADWLAFCEEHGIEYSPHTVGRNVFYSGGFGGVEIHFGEPSWDDLPRLPDDAIDFSAARPPNQASDIRVSTFHMGNTAAVADVARKIARRWRCRSSCDPELKGWRHGKEGLSKALVAEEQRQILDRALLRMGRAFFRRGR